MAHMGMVFPTSKTAASGCLCIAGDHQWLWALNIALIKSTEFSDQTIMFSEASATILKEFARKLGDKSACIRLDGLPIPYKHMNRIWITHPHVSNLTCLSWERLARATGARTVCWPMIPPAWPMIPTVCCLADVTSIVQLFEWAVGRLEELTSLDLCWTEEELSDLLTHWVDQLLICRRTPFGWQTLCVRFICCYAFGKQLWIMTSSICVYLLSWCLHLHS